MNEIIQKPISSSRVRQVQLFCSYPVASSQHVWRNGIKLLRLIWVSICNLLSQRLASDPNVLGCLSHPNSEKLLDAISRLNSVASSFCVEIWTDWCRSLPEQGRLFRDVGSDLFIPLFQRAMPKNMHNDELCIKDPS